MTDRRREDPSLGSSQWTPEQISAANRIARHDMAVSQSYYNLFNRSVERDSLRRRKTRTSESLRIAR
jgi:aryl-alcohol dehydrogenase-like predicted oxidoreductase